MQRPYKSAFVLGSHRVFGYRLRPFSIGHAYLLDVLDSAWEHPQIMTLGDLALAVRICRMDWARGLALIHRSGSGLWGIQSIPALLRGWHRELIAFGEYIEECCDVPDRWESGPGSSTSSLRVPWQLAIFRRLSAGLSPRDWPDVWDLPVCTAFVLDASRNATDDSLISDEELEAIANLESLNAES